MKMITAIRDSLNHIPDVFRSTPPEQKERGERSGIKTIWKPQINDSIGLVPDYSEDSPSSPPAFEECFEFTVNAKEEDILKVLQGPKGQSLKEAARVIGVDALGWYVPFHYLGSQWGIYLNSIGIVYLAEVLKKIPLDLSSRCTIAASLIHAHEYFHFAHEYMCS